MALSFRIGNIPVRVMPPFFFMALVFGASLQSPVKLALWVAVVFVSVVVHELGHATMGRAFGLEPSVVLHATGGTTSWTGSRNLSAVQRMAISGAGPVAGFVLGALVLVGGALTFGGPIALDFLRGLPRGSLPAPGLGAFVIETLLYVNFWWGILNLLPMLPLDGGNIMAQALNAMMSGRGEKPARIISILLAAAAAVFALVARSLWPAFLAASFVASNWQGLRALSAAERAARKSAPEAGPR